MTEADELVARLREGFSMAAQEEAATALTAAHETIDAQRERIAKLEEALEAIERGDDSIDGMAADIARAALSAES